MSAGLTFRLARAAVFAVVCLGLGVVAHLSGGGGVSAGPAVCGLAVAFLAALPASGGERGMGVIWPMLAGMQVAFHLLFSTGPLFFPAAFLAPLAETGGHPHSGLVPGLGMLVMHGAAGALTALWLSRGEAALWAALRYLAIRLCRLLLIRCETTAAPPGVKHPGSSAPVVFRSALLRHAVSRRGPPSPMYG
ncbi:MFS transporter [Streptosporangium subroseum]|uniref:MFS transporter n=1 Tax=Streptosporangium subroseum TaxID=106412 RepID=UPI003090D17D|nr:MFS transporter [Streptosporangium subroseum]